MARWTIKNVKISGVSAAVPDRIVETHEFEILTPEEAKTFDDTVGIKKRYIAPDNICASDLCSAAAVKLLDDLGWERESIDILIFASVTGDYKIPPTSCILQYKLGLPQSTFTLDLPMGCCGFMYAMTVAGNLLTNGHVKRALLLVGDTALRMGSLKDKSRVPLFGDCGTATAIEYDPTAEPIIVEFETFGKGYEALITPHGGFRNPVTPDSFKYEDFGNGIVRAPIHTLINGMDVFAFAISKPPRSILNFMQDYGIDKDRDVDFFLIHQANKMIVDRIVKKLQIDPNKAPYDLEEFGNLGGASIPTLMVARIQDVLRTKPTSLLMSSFGLGLTLGTMHMKTKPMVVSELVKI